MSVLGDIARVDPAELDRLRSRADAYEILSREAPTVDLDRYWNVLRFAMDAAAFPVNPIGGRPFPDESSAWGEGMPHSTSCALTPGEVRQAAAHLAATSFGTLAVHLTAAEVGHLYPLNRDWASRGLLDRVDGVYVALVGFFQEAAAAGQCTVFWAA